MPRDRLVLFICAFVLLAAIAAIGALPSLNTRVPSFLLLYAVAFAAYLAASRVVLRARECNRGTLYLIVAVCAVAHATVIPARPDLSTDIYRYAWEGRIVLDGFNPFAASPQDTTFAALRDAHYAHISHQHMPTIYPPLAQGAFALAAWVHPGPIAIKTLFSLFNLGTVLVLFRLLARRERPEAHAILFAWNPLAIIESGHSGHVDAMGVFFLVLAIYCWESRRRMWAALVLGASVLVKYLALATVPWLVRRRYAGVVAVVALVILAGYVPFMGAGFQLFASLREYTTRWWFNGPPFLALSSFLGDPLVARRLLIAGGLAFTIAAAHRERDLARYTYLVMGCALLVSPTVYPWYLMWIIPLLCLFPNRGWIAFTGLVMLSYGVWDVNLATGEWFVPTWLLVIEYAPFYFLLLAGLSNPRRRAWAPA